MRQLNNLFLIMTNQNLQ